MAYRPPQLQKHDSESLGLMLTKQKAHNSHFASAPDLESELAFPRLGEELRTKEGESLDFASVANRVDHVPIEESDEQETTIPPGWICLRMKDGKITDRHLATTTDHCPHEEDVERAIYEMVNRWQSERDSLNELLGDMSPYWDSLPIGEELDDD